MESLLSLSFDYLSSYDAVKIRKGLRQLEGLLAQICLSRSAGAVDRRQSVIGGLLRGGANGGVAGGPKDLAALGEDKAFREFFRLQEGFEWNVALRLTTTLERLLSKSSTGANDLLLISTLDVLQGILLLHPPSRTLFAREIHMNLLLDLLDPSTACPAIQGATLLTLVTALLDTPANTRTFEQLDGLLTVTSLFKSRGTGREVKMKVVEFCYFYLMPETPSPAPMLAGAAGRGGGDGWNHNNGGSGGGDYTGMHRSPSKRAAHPSNSGGGGGGGAATVTAATKTTEEKQALLGRYLNNVEDLVEDLRESAPFGACMV